MLDNHANSKATSDRLKPSKIKPVADVWQSLCLDSLVCETAIAKRNLVTQKMKLIEPKLEQYAEKAEFPYFIVQHFADINYGEAFAPKEFGGFGATSLEKHQVGWEVCKYDAGVGTFLGVHFTLGVATIEACGDAA